MTPNEQAFTEGFAETLQRYAFMAGYLEALIEMGVDVDEAVEVLLEGFERVQLRVVEDVVEPAGEAPSLCHPETYFVRLMSNLSPPEMRRAA